MAQVTVVINSREYAIACENGQEARIMQLAGILEEKAQMLKDISGQINENMLLAMIGILVADDLTEARKAAAAPVAAPVVAETAQEEMQKIDAEVAARLSRVCEKIKSVAKAVETL